MAVGTFLSGFGMATFLIYGWQILYELVRHRSMLEYQYPNVATEWFFFAALGLLVFVVGGLL